MKKLTFLLVLITSILFIGLGAFSSPLLVNTETEADKDKYLNIMTVNKPQQSMVRDIVGSKHNVEYMLKSEQDILDFEYNKNTLDNISNMDIFIYHGLNFEPWNNKFIDDLSKGYVGIINMSRGIRTSYFEQNNKSGENPYYFLGISEYKVAMYNIKQSIQEKDPKYREYYEENYNTLINKIDEKTKATKNELAKYSGYTIMTDTDSFDYLFKEMGIPVVKTKGKTINKVLEENALNPKRVIFVKDADPILKSKAQIEAENKAAATKVEEEVAVEKQQELQTISLKRYDENKSYWELIEQNVNALIDAIKINTENNKK